MRLPEARRAIDARVRSALIGPLFVSLLALAAGALLAAHHPTQPWLASAAFVLWFAAAMRWGGLWLFVLPAILPAASFAPWTGWIMFEEFDLIVLGAIAAGYARVLSGRLDRSRSLEQRASAAPMPRSMMALGLSMAAISLIAFLRAMTANVNPAFAWYDSYADPLNAVRELKSLVYALLLVPLIRSEIARSLVDTVRRFNRGMLCGAAIVVSAAIWERAAYPGLFDFAASYRTVALFWEMHVGGAAIDGYLAIAMPFVAWAALTASTPTRWGALAILVLAAEYACLTTFSRGVYLAVCGSMAAFGIVLARRGGRPQPPSWLRPCNVLLAVLIILQGVAVVGSESFMLTRMKRSPLDFGSRLIHWQHAIDLLKGPADWWLGIGLGRFPTENNAAVATQELPGDARVVSTSTSAHLSLRGPARNQYLAGLYSITQRVPIEPVDYRIAFDVRAAAPVQIEVSVCEKHLLYESACQAGIASAAPTDGHWQRLTVPMQGPRLEGSSWPPRSAVLSITVLNAGTGVDLTNIVLSDGGPSNLLRNGDFSRGLAHWFPIASDYFVPWHIDNLYLELLIEQGIAGLLAFAAMLGVALRRLLSPRNRGLPLAPVLVGSLVGAMLVGLVSSLLDVPRVGFLLYFLALLSIQSTQTPGASEAL